jgi:type II secretory pathway predicted ATPase ExeA
MYEAFYGLRERPFDLVPNPRFLFLAGKHREALSNLRYGLTTPRGLTLLLGEAGTGKTTLVQSALANLPNPGVRCVLVSNPTLTRPEFYECLAQSFGLQREGDVSKTRFLFDLRRDLNERFQAGMLSAVIFDEAQSLPYELLEEIRLLSNIETTTTKLLNVVLAGQPELAERLNEPGLRQLKQRISLRCHLEPLQLPETAAYIAGRLRMAGGAPETIFTREAVAFIHQVARGLPRTINVVCDNALIGGFAAQMKPVTVRFVEEVCRDFDLAAGSAPREDASERPEADGDIERSPQALPVPDLTPQTADDPLVESVERRRRFSFF